MSKPVWSKMLLKEGERAALLNLPEGYEALFADVPSTNEVTRDLEGVFQWVVLFALNSDVLKEWTPKIISHLGPDAKFWVAYPKKSSKIKTDISRDSGWDVLKENGFEGVSLVSVDGIWSAFRVRHQDYIKK